MDIGALSAAGPNANRGLGMGSVASGPIVAVSGRGLDTQVLFGMPEAVDPQGLHPKGKGWGYATTQVVRGRQP